MTRTDPPTLTARQLQVLTELADGKNFGDIAAGAYLAVNTVKTHARKLYRTLGARTSAHAVAIGYQRGPAVPAIYTPDDDVNPVCGCHRRSQCLGCGCCTSCDACYCGED